MVTPQGKAVSDSDFKENITREVNYLKRRIVDLIGIPGPITIPISDFLSIYKDKTLGVAIVKEYERVIQALEACGKQTLTERAEVWVKAATPVILSSMEDLLSSVTVDLDSAYSKYKKISDASIPEAIAHSARSEQVLWIRDTITKIQDSMN